ncbi:hypothetical protein H072_605 [Dactylellina haptotyla CBS 200.50]|uniref:Kelch repeat protein n=1 Tax=Dactylellina haptotyla (strain CBS 200.50) TaxID=1284197 RepID=S8AR09_DACHA|nr:hypothetical protein H072_605 [Dactylellina haptotyla CBS 200.50]
MSGSTDGLCSLYDQRVAVVNDTLYFTSGSYLFSRDRKPASDPKIHKINLADNLGVDGIIAQALIETEDAPDAGIGAFFYNEELPEKLWAYAAVRRSVDTPDSVNQTDTMWAYYVTAKQWNSETIDGGEYQWFNQTNGFVATAPDGRSWYGGGRGLGIYKQNPGLVYFEGNAATPKWSFIKEPIDSEAIDTPSTVGGSAVYVPAGDAGIIVLMGGFDSTVKGTMFAEGSGLDWDLRPLSDIYVYDIATNIWNRITATGITIPTERAEFCTVVNSAPDGSYHNIVLYGGWSQFYEAAFADVWVLTLPAFHWIQVDDQNNPDTRTSVNNLDNPAVTTIGRTRHKCNLYKTTQMIVTGGIVSQLGDIKLNIDACNATHPPFLVLDTNTFVWKASISSDSQDYEVPSFVQSAVRNRNSPASGWPNARVENLFTLTPIPTTSSTTSSAPTNAESTSPAAKSGLSTGGIAGAAVGGVLVLFFIIGAILFWLRHRKQLQEPFLPGPYDYFEQGGGGLSIWPKAELPSNLPPAELPNNYSAMELPAGTNNAELPAESARVELMPILGRRREPQPMIPPPPAPYR